MHNPGKAGVWHFEYYGMPDLQRYCLNAITLQREQNWRGRLRGRRATGAACLATATVSCMIDGVLVCVAHTHTPTHTSVLPP